MGYVNTPAFMTESNAFHAGDDVWPGNPALIVRRANVDSPMSPGVLNTPGGAYLGDLGFDVSMIGPLINALTTTGTSVYSAIESHEQANTAKRQEKKAEQAAAAQAAAAQAAAANAQVQANQQAHGGSNYMPWIIGAASLGAVALLVFALKR